MDHPDDNRRPQALRDRIEEAIVSGRYQPGDRLEEKVLADELNVSRTPVREALRQLHEAGLVEIRPRRGALVRVLSPADLLELFEVMAGLEALAGRLAARRLDPAGRDEILACHEACRLARDGDADAYYYQNELFHLAIYRASRNSYLADQATALHRRLKPYRRLQLRSLNRVTQSFQEHEAVVAALLDGDGDRVAELLWGHITIQADRFHDFFASLEEVTAARD